MSVRDHMRRVAFLPDFLTAVNGEEPQGRGGRTTAASNCQTMPLTSREKARASQQAREQGV